MDRGRHRWQNSLVLRRIPRPALLWLPLLCAFILAAHGSTQTNKPKGEVWWSLKPVERPALPEGPESNPVDRFINAELRNRHLRAAGSADRLTLLRRVYLDLIGIPPSPSHQQEFLADESADAYEKVVDHLLASPHFGERWARHWLDVVRFAESQGFERNRHRPHA